ncbi:MAG TPA: YCF48-related protein, partial [Dongiaceae bacterium]
MNWRTHWPTGVLFAFLAASAIGMPRAAAQRAAAEIDSPPPTVDEAICDDAALTNLCFVDRNTGWAVGDRGVIWHTRDGGASWRRQASGVAAPLKSVYFLDAARGWAVGGANRPYAAGTEGIVLQTIDGGATWARLASEMLPALAGVRFFDAQHGLAFGGASPTASSGLFATRDGGRSWLPLPGDGAGDWLAGDFLDPVAGALAGSGGRFATLARRQVITSPLATTSLRSFRAMRLLPPTGGWVVGDGGLVATTGDLGRSWQTPAGDLPDRAADHFDFCAVAVQGPHVWIAGSPGSRVFRSSDGGQTWQAHATGRAAPIRALDFVDDRHGWAVGDLGAILATQDGGRSWREQRSGGKRAALLAIFARPDGVPLEILAKQGAEEGYLAAVEVLFQTESQAAPNRGLQEAPDDAARSARTREALLLAGATSAETAWQFRLPPDELALTAAEIAEALDRANDSRASERLLAHLVRQIRMWRPNVIISHHLPNELNDPLAAIVAPLVSRAIEAAADPTQFVELATAA